MKYTVTFLNSAQDELARIWNTAQDRAAVSQAANAIDQELARDADRKGVAYEGQRVLVIEPLYVVFSVSPDDCLVTVTQVGRVP